MISLRIRCGDKIYGVAIEQNVLYNFRPYLLGGLVWEGEISGEE